MRMRFPLLMLLAGSWLAAGCASATPSWHGSPYLPPVQAPDFELEDQAGRPFQLLANTGNATLLFFGYTQCPDVCPATVANVNRVFDALGELADRLTFAFVTIDPVRDSPAVLAEYLGGFHPAFLGLTGDPGVLAQIRADYGILAEMDHSTQQGMDYTMTHTGRLFLIDPNGMLQTSYSFGTPAEEILADVRAMLGAN